MSSVANNGECASASVNRLRPVAGEGVLRAAIELLLPPACTVPRASVASPTARGDACKPLACCAAECAGAWAVLLSFPLH
ncbi:hypothetical protein FPL06_14050 [Xanthomonas citri pv. glycines]|nr:hypothetical protein BHE84_23805 [Xanthomonas citri pv. glycines str. 8ra]QDR47548.1 hypothetical protein FPK90_11170 [Xanthomonas citri pv. glycines]QDS09530.1 hypothetical protein FPL00_10865 [Xanthomonas citri pv. glycines]QDS13930.1 hypothetical protein FPL03_11135 [Xanthomonas citri pv. glycines]QDS22573.1 hypothetical protein FPL05_11235 [Xanthomonas citri pv. glycines]